MEQTIQNTFKIWRQRKLLINCFANKQPIACSMPKRNDSSMTTLQHQRFLGKKHHIKIWYRCIWRYQY